MKKAISSLVFAVFLLTNLNAQVIQGTSNVGDDDSSTASDMRFGAKAGFGVSTFTGGDFINVNPKPGFYVGGLVEIPAFMENFYLQPELIVQLQGGGNIAGDALNLLYVHIPIMGKYHITDQIAAEFGPQIGFLLTDNWDEDLSVIDTKKIHIALNIGGGYRMDENFYFQLRVTPGLTKVIEETNTRNIAFQIGASYFF